MTGQDSRLPWILIFSLGEGTLAQLASQSCHRDPVRKRVPPCAGQVTPRSLLNRPPISFCAFSHYAPPAMRPVQPRTHEASALYLWGNNYVPKERFFCTIFYFELQIGSLSINDLIKNQTRCCDLPRAQDVSGASINPHSAL